MMDFILIVQVSVRRHAAVIWETEGETVSLLRQTVCYVTNFVIFFSSLLYRSPACFCPNMGASLCSRANQAAGCVRPRDAMGPGQAWGFSEGSNRLAGDKGQRPETERERESERGKDQRIPPRATRTSEGEQLRTDRKWTLERGRVVRGKRKKREAEIEAALLQVEVCHLWTAGGGTTSQVGWMDVVQ